MGLIDAIGSFFSQGWSQQFDAEQAGMARQFNAEQAALDRQWQEMMWNKNNEYNSPAAQMARARAAGLNPSLLYGQPVAESQVSTSGAQAAGSAASGSPVNLGGVGSEADIYTKLSLAAAQRDLIRAQADEIAARIPNYDTKRREGEAHIEDLLASASQRAADTRLKYAQVDLTEAQRENISFEQSLKNGYLELDIQKFELSKQLTQAQISQIQASVRQILARAKVTERELQEMIWTYSIRRDGLEKQNLLTDAQIRQANATVEKLNKEGLRLDQTMMIDSVRADQSKVIMDGFESDNPVDRVQSLILYGLNYATDRISFGLHN